jgi:acyl-CoA thioesterase II
LTQELLRFCSARPCGDDRFEAEGPDWHGGRVFGGIVLAQAVSAALQTVDPSRAVHSMHGYFLRPERPGTVDVGVERVRDGRTFSTRAVTLYQDGRELFRATGSFHGGDEGDEYQLTMPPDVPSPDEIEPEVRDVEDDEPWFDVRNVGPTPILDDGTYASTKRAWMRCTERLPDDPAVHATLGAHLSDMTWTSFRPLRMDEWGHSADASVDHAVWFHRPFRVDEWIYQDFQALINASGRATVRGCFYTQDGGLVLSMAQELLIRPLDTGPAALG